MRETTLAVEPLVDADVALAIEALSLAFEADPMFDFLLPDASTRRSWLRFVFAGTFALARPDGHVTVVKADGVAGALELVPPGRYPPPVARIAGWLGAPWRWPTRRAPPWHLVRRGVQVVTAMEHVHHPEPHWYVQVFGVHPDHQGRGVGRALMDAGLALADRDHMPAYLETTNPVNLPLYRRFGFEVVREIVLPGGFPPLWTMLRPARP